MWRANWSVVETPGAIPPAAARAPARPHGRERRRAAVAAGRAPDPAPPAARAGPSSSPSAPWSAGSDEIAADPAVAGAMAARIARDGARAWPATRGCRRLRGAAARLARRPRVAAAPPSRRQCRAGKRAELQPGRALAGHDDVGRHRPRSRSGHSSRDRPPGTPAASPAPRPGRGWPRVSARPIPWPCRAGLDRERAEQQCRPVAEPDRPVADRRPPARPARARPGTARPAAAMPSR